MMNLCIYYEKPARGRYFAERGQPGLGHYWGMLGQDFQFLVARRLIGAERCKILGVLMTFSTQHLPSILKY